MEKFDLAVIGTGPAGHFGAIQAAKAGKKVVAIEAARDIGGVSATFGTIPSKALREATIHLTGQRQQAFRGHHYRVKDELTIQDLTLSTHQIVSMETSLLEAQLRRNNVTLVRGLASFVGPNQLVSEGSSGVRILQADKILIATGSRPARAPGVDFDGERVVDSNQVLKLDKIPRRMIIVGAGVIGVEYACIFACLGSQITLINKSENLLDFVDRQISDVLRYHMRNRGVLFRFGEDVQNICASDDGVLVETASGKRIAGDCLLYSVGRQGNVDRLNLEAAEIEADSRGRISVNEHFQTEAPHVYAVGDVIGFPALASTSREQGRRAACHAFDIGCSKHEVDLPYGIYTIPEISMVGPTEEQLTRDGIPYEVGRATYREIARGHLLGDLQGVLKILFDPDSAKILATHAIGDGATELVHLGQMAKAMGGTLDYFADAVFNYPTLAECYKVAALDGLNRRRLVQQQAESCRLAERVTEESSQP